MAFYLPSSLLPNCVTSFPSSSNLVDATNALLLIQTHKSIEPPQAIHRVLIYGDWKENR